MVDIEIPVDEDESQGDKTFSKIVALTVCAYAVALSITSLGGGNNGRDIMMSQMQASNDWAYYQAKAARETLYKAEAREVEFLLLDRGPQMEPKAKEAAEKMLADFKAEEQRYNKEKKDIQAKAVALEASRDLNSKREPFFDYGEVFLQVALVLASVAMLSESLMAYVGSLIAALAGGVLSINAFFLFYTLPEVVEKVST